MTPAARADVRVVGVSRLANYIAKSFERDKNLARLGVRGEISNLRTQPNGNVYFTLKDRDALLDCVAFSEAAAGFPALANGDQVVAYGNVQTYPKASRYQLRAYEVVAEGGIGVLHQRYEALKARLAAEGLFAPERKRALPRYPFRVALVTSAAADGARDFVMQARARAPHVELAFFATPVQGERAAPEIVRAIQRANASGADILVVARGGGSYEDLFAFSDERVVRALAASRIPTVSAIGHEADAPLTDFVADVRAATPSSAAQTILPRRDDLLALVAERRRVLSRDVDRIVSLRRQHVDVAARHLAAAMRQRIARARERVVAQERRLEKGSPGARLAQRRERFEHLRVQLDRDVAALLRRRAEQTRTLNGRLVRADPRLRIARAGEQVRREDDRLTAAIRRFVEGRRARWTVLAASLETLNPEAVLQRGYAIVRNEDGHVLRDPAQARPASRITATLARGVLTARVEAEGTDGGRQIELF
ncbi:MAG TPA: exodeoxyribonuclease VII large subunit [Candidatus Baltobacteraceae bacterium]|nr:exodeoxyribonuclease VII large subunit [Candidatus Baltobacteraceae bacterium]